MDRKVWLQYLTPDEAVARRERCSALLIPIAPIEWHGPHLPLGVDALCAGHDAERAAQILGATVYPTLFVGTERERRPEMLRSIGLPEKAHIEGMDFPRNNYKSFYFREEVFALVLRNVIGMAKANGYQVVRIVNGHGAENQLAVIARLCAELDDPRGQRVIADAPAAPARKPKPAPTGKAKMISAGHATADETSTMMAFEPDTVHLERLPPPSRPLRCADFAIVDGPTFDCLPTPDHTVRREVDPRTHSSAAEGRRRVEAHAQRIAAQVRAILKRAKAGRTPGKGKLRAR
jgi:creatinine amidohydrolase